MFKRLWYNARARSVMAQVLIACVFFGTLGWLAWNAHTNLTQRGIATGFGYLSDAARFPISESLVAYRPTDSYARAFLVGLINTLFMSALVIVVSTVLGFLLALARRSSHPLVNGIGTVYLEITRNTPLVVQLLFWYSLVTINLPSPRQALNPLPDVFLSIRGLFFPSVQLQGDWLLLVGTLCAALLIWLGLRPLRRRRPALPLGRWFLVLTLLACVLAWQWGGLALVSDAPQLRGLNFVGGTALTPEFTALLIGLTLYSAAFSGEIIRSGIDAVAHGQWEAAQSLGLRPWTTLRHVIVPQSLRVIVPPMTTQYLSIVKNTTLALAVGYPDLSFVITTTINQTGQAIEGLVILMGVYLCISLSVSLFMNLYNRRILRTERP